MGMGRPRTTNKDLPAGVRKIRGRYYYQGTKGSNRASEPLGSDPTEMRKKWLVLHFVPEKTVDTPSAGTLAELLDRYEREEIPRKAAAVTRRQYRGYVAQIRASLGHRRYARSEAEAATLPGAIRRMDVAGIFRNGDKKVANNRRAAVLKDVFRCAAEWGYTEYNPVLGVRRNKEVPRDRLPTDEERVAIQETRNPLVNLVVRFGQITGWRKADILRLHEGQISDAGVALTQGKTGKKQLWEWSPTLRQIIEEARALRPIRRIVVVGGLSTSFIFCKRNGMPYSEEGFDTAWQKEKKALGITGLHFHDIRADAISQAKEAGMNSTDFAGHSDAAVTRRVYERLPVKVKPLE